MKFLVVFLAAFGLGGGLAVRMVRKAARSDSLVHLTTDKVTASIASTAQSNGPQHQHQHRDEVASTAQSNGQQHQHQHRDEVASTAQFNGPQHQHQHREEVASTAQSNGPQRQHQHPEEVGAAFHSTVPSDISAKVRALTVQLGQVPAHIVRAPRAAVGAALMAGSIVVLVLTMYSWVRMETAVAEEAPSAPPSIVALPKERSGISKHGSDDEDDDDDTVRCASQTFMVSVGFRRTQLLDGAPELSRARSPPNNPMVPDASTSAGGARIARVSKHHTGRASQPMQRSMNLPRSPEQNMERTMTVPVEGLEEDADIMVRGSCGRGDSSSNSD